MSPKASTADLSILSTRAVDAASIQKHLKQNLRVVQPEDYFRNSVKRQALLFKKFNDVNLARFGHRYLNMR